MTPDDNKRYSGNLQDALNLLEDIAQYPLLMEKLAKTPTAKDFYDQMKIYFNDENN